MRTTTVIACGLLAACSGGSSRRSDASSDVGPVTLGRSTQSSASSPLGAGQNVFFLASELERKKDLNGDGDTLDGVAHVWNTSTGAVRNLRLAESTSHEPEAGPTFFSFVVSEDENGKDLDDDGDTSDWFHFVDDPIAATTTRSMLPITEVSVVGPKISLLVSEDSYGGDLNGDGDAIDLVEFLANPANGTTTSVGTFLDDSVVVWNDIAAQARTDALYAFDLTTCIETVIEPIEVLDLDGGRDFAAFVISETTHGSDLNRDGDLDDEVVGVYAFPTQFARLTAIAKTKGTGFGFADRNVAFPGALSGEPGVVLVDILGISAKFVPIEAVDIDGLGENLLVTRSEADESVDLNGDGDMDDRVPSHVSSSTLATTSLGLAVNQILVLDDRAILGVYEQDQGGVDATGDGFAVDQLLFLVDEDGEVTDLHLAGSVLGTLAERFVLVRVTEETEDLNDDGDLFDAVLHVLDLDTGELHDLRVAVPWSDELSAEAHDSVFPFLVSEQSQGGTDLDGDGDASGQVLYFVRPR